MSTIAPASASACMTSGTELRVSGLNRRVRNAMRTLVIA